MTLTNISNIWRVLIEFKRIQSYLFAVPRLRTMLGANVAMGEMLRIRLPELAIEKGACMPACGASISPGCGAADDPLADVQPPDARDNPNGQYKQGILARDGGHFQALFADRAAAESFADAAHGELEDRLDGLPFDIRVEQWHPDPTHRTLAASWLPVLRSARTTQVLPATAQTPRACEWSGQEGATYRLRPDLASSAWVTRKVKQQWLAGKRFARGRTNDVVGLLQRAVDGDGKSLLPCRTPGEWALPKDLEQLAGGAGCYLALVHLDGNRVGLRKPPVDDTPLIAGETEDDAFGRWLASEARIETFFHTMRAQVRRALVVALTEVFADLQPPKGGMAVMPYQLLMVGGDDVLLLMGAEHALPFVVAYGKALTSSAGAEALDFGAGVAIAPPTFRFHALHELADELVSSAKRLSRAVGNQGRSVVDWSVVTSASATGLAAHRRTHDLVRYRVGKVVETLITNGRPYFVLPKNGATPRGETPSLQELLATAEALRQDPVARSQRKALPGAMRQGRYAAIDAIADLPNGMLETLREHRAVEADDPWICAGCEPHNSLYLSHLPDILELAEIPDLGVAKAATDAPASATEATP